MYSNSKFDESKQSDAVNDDTGAVKTMYEYAPYPDLGANLKDPSDYIKHIQGEMAGRKNICFLEAGCGTGHHLVGTAKRYPDWKCSGIDLSSASLEIARQLAANHSVNVDVHQGSYLDKLPFEEKSFDVISAMGTIHHCSDPVGAINNLAKYMKDDGWMFMHMYGMRCDQKKFDIKEMLSIFEPDLTKYEKRFSFYNAYIKHQKKDWVRYLANLSMMDVYHIIKKKIYDWKRKKAGITWSPAFTEKFDEPNSPWIDHFCHPCERAYEVRDLQDTIEKSDLEVVFMLGQGREDFRFMPPEWMLEYQRLSPWDKWRLNELLAPGDSSFRMILKKK